MFKSELVQKGLYICVTISNKPTQNETKKNKKTDSRNDAKKGMAISKRNMRLS